MADGWETSSSCMILIILFHLQFFSQEAGKEKMDFFDLQKGTNTFCLKKPGLFKHTVNLTEMQRMGLSITSHSFAMILVVYSANAIWQLPPFDHYLT